MTEKSDDGPRAELPAKSVLSARELLNWVAFGRAVDVDLTGFADFRSKWGLEPRGAGNLSLALREIETGAKCPEVSAAIWARRAREFARGLVQRWEASLPLPYLRLAIEAQTEDYWRRCEALHRAASEITDRAAGGLLHVLARAVVPSDPAAGRYRPSASGPAFRLKPEIFATANLQIHPSGEIEVPGHPGYLDAQFYIAQIQLLWPDQRQRLGGVAKNPFSAPPQEAPPAESPQATKRGQPSSKHLLTREANARAETGAMLSDLGAEAEHLVHWIRIEHPNAKGHPTVKTAKRHISLIHKDYRRRPKV